MDPSERPFDERKPTWLQRISNHRRRQITTAFRVEARQLLPSFFIVGPPRTGTSWLHEVLRGHAILPSPTKETRFFDSHFNRGLEWYRAHYPAGEDRLPVGEIAPTYFAAERARLRIAQVIPQARIVCVFRDPLERLLSLYRVKRAYGLIAWSFEQACRQDPEFIETSRYSINLRAWRSLSAGQVLATVYDDLRDDPQTYLDQVVDFIGIPRFCLTQAQKCSVHASEKLTHPRNYNRTRNASRMADWLKAQRMDGLVAAVRKSPLRRLFLGGGRPFAEPSAEFVLRLREFFLPEIETMEWMLNRDLSGWKRAKAEPLAGAASDTV